MDNNFNMTFEESQDYITKRGFDILWNDCNVFVDGREINRTVGNVLKWADKTMIEKACKWLEKNRNELSRIDTSGFVELFKKAMEE